MGRARTEMPVVLLADTATTTSARHGAVATLLSSYRYDQVEVSVFTVCAEIVVAHRTRWVARAAGDNENRMTANTQNQNNLVRNMVSLSLKK